MLYKVEMTVNLPSDMPAERADAIKATEKKYSQQLQESGRWRHLWRIAGTYSNISIFDVEDNATLHELIAGLPLFPYMNIEVAPLCRHPSSIRDDNS